MIAALAIVTVMQVFPPAPPPDPDPVELWRPIVALHFEPDHVDDALRVMACESRGDVNARNSHSTAAGLFQFLRGTWNWVAPEVGLSPYETGAPYNPWQNIRAAAFLSRGGTWWAHWVCQP